MSELKADEETGARHLSFVCGVIERTKLPVFERVLWRSSRGKAKGKLQQEYAPVWGRA